jgi:DNA-directed RNA polymerase subunit beta'
MLGLKENVITGHPIPAGTGLRDFDQIIVGSKEEYELLQTTREAMAFDEEE